MRKARELKQMAILGFAGVFGLAAIGGFVNQNGWPGDVGAVHLQDTQGPPEDQAPKDLLADDDRIRRIDDDSFGFDGFDDEDDDVDLDSTLDATNTGGVGGGAANTANTGDGDDTRGDDGTSGGNNTANTVSAANTANTGDGDNTRGDDGTSGGNNTADNDTQSRGGTT
jgi:hypothetical protein